MSVELSLDTIEEQLYVGHARGPCSYLAKREAALLFLDGLPIGEVYRMLMDQGYRRHGLHLYRPDCSGCQECQVLRIPVSTFQMNRNQRRVWQKGLAAFDVRIVEPRASREKNELYLRYLDYQHQRHKEEAADLASYQSFFVDSFLADGTRELQLWQAGKLAGVGIFDRIADALSAVYFFFEPDVARLSPGKFNILYLLDLARQEGRNYLYPGFYISACKAMNYKSEYQPNQRRRPGEQEWQEFLRPA
ncbi:MAG: arginyltransferase [Leptospiraceae bacterium]|nr:arginyltransferase [Leptospiraceae bacterium]